MKKYMDIAQRFPGAVLMQLYGDESADTRKLMVSMKVKVRRGRKDQGGGSGRGGDGRGASRCRRRPSARAFGSVGRQGRDSSSRAPAGQQGGGAQRLLQGRAAHTHPPASTHPPAQVTPTFALYRGGEQVGTVTGVSDAKLLRAMVDAMTPAELEGHEEDVFELEAAEKELAEQEASAPAAARKH
jgi:hypothetical protein